jgi:uncharacterized protein
MTEGDTMHQGVQYGAKPKRWFRISLLSIPLLLHSPAIPQATPQPSGPSGQRRIIDMHLHALPVTTFGEDRPVAKTKTEEQILQETLAEMNRFHVVKAVTSGPVDLVLKWKAIAPDLIIASPVLPFVTAPVDIETLRNRYRAGELGAVGEVTAQYGGMSPADPALEPLYALAEEFDVPLGIHMGPGPPGAAYKQFPRFRMSLANPLLLEDVLVRHPKMRIYVMHAGWPFIDEMIGLLYAHPQVYVELGVIDWFRPRKEFHNYLRRLMEAGFGKRVMFGSDQMLTPDAIGRAIAAVESADFLSEAEKSDIFYDNAARFLRLDQAGISDRRP